MSGKARTFNLLESGIFTVSEGARLLEIPSQKVRGWIAGYPRTEAAPILENELGWADGRLAFSFTNLMEIRFLAFFSNQGVSVRSIRTMAEEAKKVLRHPHPFATNTVFKTDGKKIYAATVEQTGDEKLYNLYNRNYELRPIVLQSLIDGVVYDPKGAARAWYPRPKIAPNVVIQPKHSFGKPVLKDSGIPTETLAAAARHDPPNVVAQWYEVPEARVREAIKFEQELKRAA